MKKLGREIMISLFMGMIVPGILLNLGVALWNRQNEQSETQQGGKLSKQNLSVQLPVKIRDSEGNTTEGILDDYLVGVVLAEMPASFEEDALKAQAVVARTYARKAYVTGGKHGDGSICTQSSCCQAYVSEETYLEKGGTSGNIEKIKSAVYSTSGQVLMYEGQLIEATYFSCSGGSTEDAAAVWGTDFPYLQAVDSPGEENAAYYRDVKRFTAEEVEAALGIRLTGDSDSWIGEIIYTDGGGVATVCIGGKSFEGTQVRSLLGLRSTAFSVELSDGIIILTTRGYGHRVGMSQYGADAMAVTGSTYEEILAHYYQGTELIQLPDEGGRVNDLPAFYILCGSWHLQRLYTYNLQIVWMSNIVF